MALRVAKSGRSMTPRLFTHTSFQTSHSPFQQLSATRAHSCLVPVKFPPHQLRCQIFTHQTGPKTRSQGLKSEPRKAPGTFMCLQLCQQVCSSLPLPPAFSSASSPAWPSFQNSFMHAFGLTYAKNPMLQGGLQFN